MELKNTKKKGVTNAYVHCIHYTRVTAAGGDKIAQAVTEIAHGNWKADCKTLTAAFNNAAKELMREIDIPDKRIRRVLAHPMLESALDVCGTHTGTDFQDEETGMIHLVNTDSIRIGKKDAEWDEVVIRYQAY